MGLYSDSGFHDREQDDGDSVEIACTLIYQTENAYLIDDGSDRHTWVPKSQVRVLTGPTEDDDPDELVLGESYTFSIPYWLAESKGFL